MPSESNSRQKDNWDKVRVVAEVVIALAALAFNVVSYLNQKKNADATLELSRSNFELAKSQVKVSLLPSLSSENARQQTMALSLAKTLDEQFAADAATAIASSDANEDVREKARAILGGLAQSGGDEVKQKAEKGADQYDLMKELHALGLLKKLQAARGSMEGGSPNGNEEALNLYGEVLGQLSNNALEKLDRGLLMDAQRDEKDGYKEHAARKYRVLFEDYGG